MSVIMSWSFWFSVLRGEFFRLGNKWLTACGFALLNLSWSRSPIFLKIVAKCIELNFLRSPACRSQQRYAINNVYSALGKSYKVNHNRLWAEKKLKETLLYLNNEHIIGQLRRCADELECYLRENVNDERPVILSPLHMVSDVLASVMCGFTSPQETLVISTHKDDALGSGEDASLHRMGIRLKKLDPARVDSTTLRRALRAVKDKKSKLVIFADAPAEITLTLTGKQMRTYDCLLFNRPAHLHSGLNELARLSDARVVFFGLYCRSGRLHLKIFGLAEASELPMLVPAFVEQALKSYPESWLLWYSPSLFYFNNLMSSHYG
jgi:hypothetical protein